MVKRVRINSDGMMAQTRASRTGIYSDNFHGFVRGFVRTERQT